MIKRNKRYTYDTTGEGVFNPKFYGWIEIWDSQCKTGYPLKEIRYFVKAEDESKFRDFWDNFESDWPVYLGPPLSTYKSILNKEYYFSTRTTILYKIRYRYRSIVRKLKKLF